jgi:hypothetical protein
VFDAVEVEAVVVDAVAVVTVVVVTAVVVVIDELGKEGGGVTQSCSAVLRWRKIMVPWALSWLLLCILFV